MNKTWVCGCVFIHVTPPDQQTSAYRRNRPPATYAQLCHRLSIPGTHTRTQMKGRNMIERGHSEHSNASILRIHAALHTSIIMRKLNSRMLEIIPRRCRFVSETETKRHKRTYKTVQVDHNTLIRGLHDGQVGIRQFEESKKEIEGYVYVLPPVIITYTRS